MPAVIPRSSTFKPYFGSSLALFAVAFCFPAFYEHGRAVDPSTLLMMGWLLVFEGQFSWLANPAYLIAMVLSFKHPDKALSWAVAAFFLALSALINMAAGSGGGSIMPMDPGLGYLLWVLAMLVAVCGLKHQLRTDATLQQIAARRSKDV